MTSKNQQKQLEEQFNCTIIAYPSSTSQRTDVRNSASALVGIYLICPDHKVANTKAKWMLPWLNPCCTFMEHKRRKEQCLLASRCIQHKQLPIFSAHGNMNKLAIAYQATAGRIHEIRSIRHFIRRYSVRIQLTIWQCYW